MVPAGHRNHGPISVDAKRESRSKGPSRACALYARNWALTGSAFREFARLQLINLWEKVLNVRPIGLRDNFFDLGGNSLVAVRLFSEMRKLFGRSFPLAILFQAPTVEKLADIIRKDGWKSHWLRWSHPAGRKQAAVLLRAWRRRQRSHIPRTVETSWRGLSILWPAARGVDGSNDYLTTTEAMAESYLREMRELQPEGPYYLGGFCNGRDRSLLKWRGGWPRTASK